MPRWRLRGVSFVVASFVASVFTGCHTVSNTKISESTAPADLRTAKSPEATGLHQIIVTFDDAKSKNMRVISRLAEKRAKERCDSHEVVSEKERTGEEATSRMMGIAGPWIELTIQCLELKQQKISGLGAVVVDKESKDLPDAAYFDIHVEVLAGDYERVHAAVLKVLREQGDPPFRPEDDKKRGVIKTGRMRHGVPGFPVYEQYVIAFDILSPRETRMTFRLISHWPDFKASTSKPPLLPSERKYVYKRAAAFVDRVRGALG